MLQQSRLRWDGLYSVQHSTVLQHRAASIVPHCKWTMHFLVGIVLQCVSLLVHHSTSTVFNQLESEETGLKLYHNTLAAAMFVIIILSMIPGRGSGQRSSMALMRVADSVYSWLVQTVYHTACTCQEKLSSPDSVKSCNTDIHTRVYSPRRATEWLHDWPERNNTAHTSSLTVFPNTRFTAL